MGIRPVTIIGAFGGVNAGDEAILLSLQALVKALDQRTPIRVISLSSQITDQARDSYHEAGLTYSTARNFLKALAMCVGSDLIVGGGQLLNGTRRPHYILFMIISALISRITLGRVLMLGVGTHDLNKYKASSSAALVLANLCHRVVVRDVHSKLELSEAGYPDHNISVEPDVVLSGVLSRTRQKGSILAIAVHHHPSETHLTLDQTMSLINSVRSEVLGYRIIVVAHDVRDDFDNGLLKIIKQELPDIEVVTLGSGEMACDFYSEVDVVLSSRMHPLILGLICGATPAPLSMSLKVRDFAASYSLSTVKDPVNCSDLSLVLAANQAALNRVDERIAVNRSRLLGILTQTFGRP